MLRIAVLLLVAKVGFGIFTTRFVDLPATQLVLLVYLALLVSFIYTVIVGSLEHILKWIEPAPTPEPARWRDDDDLIDPEWIEQVTASLNR